MGYNKPYNKKGSINPLYNENNQIFSSLYTDPYNGLLYSVYRNPLYTANHQGQLVTASSRLASRIARHMGDSWIYPPTPVTLANEGLGWGWVIPQKCHNELLILNILVIILGLLKLLKLLDSSVPKITTSQWKFLVLVKGGI